MVVSQKHIAIIDPHKNCIKPKSETSPAGTKKKLSTFFKHAGHRSTFESIFNLDTSKLTPDGMYNGTIFRFPLRGPNSGSKISKALYTPEKIQSTLFESLKEESPYILLFLRHVKSISLKEWKEGYSQPRETFRVEASDQKAMDISRAVSPSIEQFAGQYSQSSEDSDLQVSIELKSKTVTISDSIRGSPESYHWLVLKVVGTNDSELDKLGKELSILPWVGLATRLPQRIALHECSASTTDPFDNHNTVEAIFKQQLQSNLLKSQVSMNWPTKPADDAPGHAYCFLPLPESTAMPVHVHGYFAITDNRRSIKWPIHDEKGKEAQWNKELLYKMVAPAYGLLLSSCASLIHYEDTPLPITNTEHVTGPYSTWPLYPEVKNVPIWNELVSPTVELSCSLPFLWTPACGGKWIQFNEAYFHPGSFQDRSSYICSDIVIQLLVTLDIPVVSLPRNICETIKQSKSIVLPLVEQREISPQFVREIISKNPDSCSSLSKEGVCKLLSFVLSDLGPGMYALLVGIPLLLLKGDSTTIAFQRPSGYNYKYIFPPNSKHLLDIVPGADSLIVDPNLPEEISNKLCKIAKSGLLQLKEVDTEVLCRQLLPTSIDSWCTVTTGAERRWVPGQDPMPPQSWMDALWKWIADSKVRLSLLNGLSVVPQLPFEDGTQLQVTLIKVCKTVNICRLSGLFRSQQKILLLGILKKFNFFVVDEGKMNGCIGLRNHPDFDEYLPELSPNLELIAKYLNGLGSYPRLQTIQNLNDGEKDFLRKQLSNLHDSYYARSYQNCLRSLPIYRDYSNARFISLGVAGATDEAFLPPNNIPPLPEYPSKMLCPAASSEEGLFFGALAVKKLNINDLCTLHLIPMSLQHMRSYSYQWSIGDTIILWILKLQPQLSTHIFTILSQNVIIFNRNSTRKRPQDIYDPDDHTLAILFDIDSDKNYFPDARYLQEAQCKQALLTMGMKTWKDVQRDSSQMSSLLHDRMNSVSVLQPSSQFNRGQFILQTLTEPNNNALQQNSSLKRVKFLAAETCPESYPPCLKQKWYGRQGTLYSIDELCSPDNCLQNSRLIGTVKPLLSRGYCYGQYSVSVNAFERLPCQRVSEALILSHLQNIQSSTISSEEADSIHQIVMSIYDYLDSNSSGSKLPNIWSRENSRFMPANKFIVHLPEGFQFNLEPYYYRLQGPVRQHKRLFQLHKSLTPTDVAGVITKISQQARDNLSDSEVTVCVSILNWLSEKQHKESSVLMLTKKCTLVSVSECVFDDREWMKHSESRSHIEGKNLIFVHDRIPQKVAKFFQVKPLSSQLAQSQRLNFGLKYTRAGQHEDITQQIRHIVEEYGTNIDIFKELIQNADDAGATEVKFLLDWREHPKNSLFADELEKWQGPALIAYNNATFSDEDFDNICILAGETKKIDPLKTGRFGVGFCATYHLTDLPSFISRRYFAMLDPHTSYLGERISAQEPGMRIDLVETRGDLKFYQDQFKPYENVFGCDVFNLQGDGYQGTIFRFPFRNHHTIKRSKICKEVYTKNKVDYLVCDLKKQSNELLLFLKNVSKVTVLVLENGHEPSLAKEIFSIQRCTVGTAERVQLIKDRDVNLRADGKQCSTKYKIDVHDGSKTHSHTWIISSAIKPLPAHMTRRHEAKGLLNLAETALKIEEPTSTKSFKILPNTPSSRVFCFLPLPTQTKLPFHVNGFFSMGSDRRTISATDDGTFGPDWNKSLAEGVLVQAFVNLLEHLCKECELKGVSDSEVKEKFLRSYYSLWNMNGMSSLIDASFATAFKKLIPTLNVSVMWSEIYGGCWLSPKEVYVFKDSKLRPVKQAQYVTDIHRTVENDAISLLMNQAYGVVDIPYHVHEILKKLLSNTKREYDYQRVCTEILFPEISSIDPAVRDRNIQFLIEQYGAYLGPNNWYMWAESFLRQKSCISCQSSNILRPGCELIDPRNGHFVNLFDASEGRFPNEELQASHSAMLGLERLGMSSKQLTIADLKGRAQSIAAMSDFQTAFQRSTHLCDYIGSTYGGRKYHYHHLIYKSVQSNTADTKINDLQRLSSICFLPVKRKPEGVDVPWSGKADSFDSPSRMYSSEYQFLVFSQSPIVEAEGESSKALTCLEISSKKPPFDLVIANLRCLISYYTASPPNELTTKFLDDAMKDMYGFLQEYHSSASAMDELKKLARFIWQDGHFLSPHQVVTHWMHNCYPYICELSTANKRFQDLMMAVGVKGEVTLNRLVEVLKEITEQYGSDPIPDKVLEFVVYAAGQVKQKLVKEYENGHQFQLYLPDEMKIMHSVSDLADNVGSESEWIQNLPAYQDFMSSGTGFYVHKSIPHDCAKVLGVNPLLEAVLKEIEDENFLDGTDFGQHEDLCDRLNGILRKYPADISILKEFIQNADDAEATEIVFVMDHRTNFPDNSLLNPSSKWKTLQHTPALCIYNNRKFTERDIQGITKLGRGGKGGSTELIGKFGVGFNVTYHVTDCPSFVSYSENGSPEYLCVFDPTQSFVSRASMRSPGRKWNFKDKTHHLGFTDQFQPYLPEDLHRFSECASDCLQDGDKRGHVVFRLPLTRFNKTEPLQISSRSTRATLSSGYTFWPFRICKLFEEFASISQDILLFLNHLKSVSAFEIKEDGSIVHHFTSTATIPSAYLDNCRHFTQSLKQYSTSRKCASMTHKVEVTHVQPDKETQTTEWLIQRAIGGEDLPPNLVKSGLSQGLRPIAGIATILKPQSSDHKYLLFCFLPLPIQSNLPVHVNSHFLVDDSRKHLESIQHEGLGNWNETIAQKVIVPAYVDLVIAVKDLLGADDSSKFYYSLFPKEVVPQTSATTVTSKEKSGEVAKEEKKIGELTNLKIVESFYRELLQRNPCVLLREIPEQSTAYTWMSLKSSLFCVPFLYYPLSKVLTVSSELRQALVSLGMPFTTAPNYVYSECTKVDPSFASKAGIEPEKIIAHLRELRCTSEHEEIIKKSIVCLLHYCISGYSSTSIPSLFTNALYLVAKDGSLQRGYLFHSKFSELLPQCSNKFIDKSLEESTIGEQLVECRVIRSLPMDFVSAHISLPNTSVARSISDCNTNIITQLWKYFIEYSRASVAIGSGNVATSIGQHFSCKAIIPASDGNLYPVKLSKIMIRSTCDCSNCHVMKKLGYPSIEFSRIFRVADTSSNLLHGIVDDLTNCFTNGEQIINSFKIQPPADGNLNIELMDEEALAFVASFQKVSVNDLKQASPYLLELPLFWTIDESRISLVGVKKVFILASTQIPLEGISTRSENGRVILKPATTDSMKKFYEGVIPHHMTATVSHEQFYIQLVLPILSEIQERSVMEHVKYLHMKRDEMEQAYAKLKDTPFIEHNGRFYKVCDLCDHEVQFYLTFKPGCILPGSWRKHTDILKELGLQSTVSTDEWLLFARSFSQNVIGGEAREKSTVLLQELFKIVSKYMYVNKNLFNYELQAFLQSVAEIKFLYSPQAWELTRILSTAFPEDKQKKADVYMVKFQGSVSADEASLTCLCRATLPGSCQQLISIPFCRQALQVELPVTPETVAENLKCLCKRVSATCARPGLDLSRLIQIFDAHYAYLSRRKASSHILHELGQMMCILPSKSHLLHLVKPSQLVMQLPSDCFLEPYCFKVMQWLQKHIDFLTAVGVKNELRSQDYVDILLSIKEEAANDSIVHDKDTRVIESAYKQLVSCLRQEQSTQLTGDIYLPDESLNLTKATELCLNDAPWYRSRLPRDCGFKIIHQPPTDDKGHRTLPSSLKIKKLSEIVTEELLETCKSPDFACNDEILFEMGKRPEGGRCEFVRGILDTLNSDEFFHGFCRMYYTEYKSPPTDDFKALVKKLKQVQVRCVLDKLKTVFSINGKPIPKTEDDTKLCHLCSEDGEPVLYIALHYYYNSDSLSESNLTQFYKHLAGYISELINNEIRNLGPITAIFECYPQDIPLVLTREQIHEYTEEDDQITKAVRIGTTEPWGSFSPHESLVVLNFTPEDPVVYVSEDGSLINAEIVAGRASGQLETDITIRVKEKDESDENEPESERTVSPLQVFKVLTAAQKRSLWKGDTSPFASPVALATIPSDDPAEIEEWFIKMKQSLFSPHPELVQSILTLRLLGHLYYQLIIQKKNPTLFHTAASKLQDVFCQSQGHTTKADMVLDLVRETATTLTSAGSAPIDVQTIFPSKELGDILEGRRRHVPHHGQPGSMSSSSNSSASVGHSTYYYDGGGVGGGVGDSTGGGGYPGGSGSGGGHSLGQISGASGGDSGGYIAAGSGESSWVGGGDISGGGGGKSSGRFASRVRRGYRSSQFSWFRPAVDAQPQMVTQEPQPASCMRSATAWLEQGKADFQAAEMLLRGSSEAAVEANTECKFPALVCFLCHDTVEKCIKGVYYAFCGLRRDLINCSNLITLHDDLNRTPHHPAHLMDAINECVMSVNRHENRSRFPNYQNYPCAPATIYSVEDAQEAFEATSKLLDLLQSDKKLKDVLQDLGQLPARRFMSAIQYIPDNQGNNN